jgi:hypothetical protein
LEQSGRWSYFNGMGADRQISYDVYQKVLEMDLFEAGFDVDWQEIEVPVVDWEGVRRSYWNVNKVSSSYNVSSAMVIRVLREPTRSRTHYATSVRNDC